MKLQKTATLTAEKMSAQKKIQNLSKKIQQEKIRLEEWQSAQTDIQARAKEEILASYTQLRQIIFQQIEALVAQKSQKLTQNQLDKVDEKIEKLSLQLLKSQQMNIEQIAFIADLLNAYGHDIQIQPAICDQDDLDQQEDSADCYDDTHPNADSEDEAAFFQSKIEAVKEMLCDEYDLEADFFDFAYDEHDPEDFMKKFDEKMEQQLQQEFLAQFRGQERKFYEKQMQREQEKQAKLAQQRERAKQIANQSIKTIYMKIAAMIHPDRELDEQKKQEKTAILQQVNHAYETQDLFRLFTLQIELGQQHNEPMAEEQLKAYNILLEEQLEQIQQEIDQIIDTFDWTDHLDDYSNRKIKIQDLYKKYAKDCADVEQKIKLANITLARYQDFKALKAMLRSRSTWELV